MFESGFGPRALTSGARIPKLRVSNIKVLKTIVVNGSFIIYFFLIYI